MLFNRSVFEKNEMITCKKLKVKREFCNFEFLQVRIAFFSNAVRLRNITFGLNIHCFIYFI